MSLDNRSNFGISELAAGINDTVTELSVAAGDGARFPDPATKQYNCVLWNITDYGNPAKDPDKEIVRVTAKTTDTFTITRAQESTVASNHNTGGKTYSFALLLTAKMISDIETELDTKAATLSGTINEIAYFNSATTIASLAVATYPSLTELSYVKGVTSALQTQLGGKAATDQTMYIGTTAVAINRGSAALTLAGITLTTPDIGTPSAGVATNITGLPTAGLVDAAVTLAKMANLAQDQFIGRVTASTGVPETATITAAARTVLDDTTVAAMVNTLGGASSTGTGGLVRATSPAITTPTGIVKGDVGLGNVDNTSNATERAAIATLTNKTLIDAKVTTTINAQTETTYTLVLTDNSKLVTLGNASAITVTIPTNASVAFPIGCQIDFIQILAGKVTFGGAGVTINSKGGNKSIAAQWVGVSLIKTATDTWSLLGELIA